MSKKCSGLGKVAWILVVIGALNWGLVGIGNFANADWNVVSWIFNGWAPVIADIVYILVGLSALVLLFKKEKKAATCAACEAGTCTVHGSGM